MFPYLKPPLDTLWCVHKVNTDYRPEHWKYWSELGLMAGFFIAFGFSLWYLNWANHGLRLLGGLVVRVEDCRADTPTGTPGSNPPRHMWFFFFKIQETCTLTTFVEQKLSLCVQKLRNFMRVYMNRKRAVWDMETFFAWGESSVTCNRRILFLSKEKIPWPFKRL